MTYFASPHEPPTNHFTLLYWGPATSFTGKGRDYIKGPLKVTELFNVIERMYPGMKHNQLDSCAVSVNGEYADLNPVEGEETLMLKEGDEVAIIPPVSAG